MISREQLESVLSEFKWDVPAVAEHIGITYSSVYKRIKKYGIQRPADFPKKNWNGGKTHCKRGHEFTLESTFPNEFGYRKCRLCDSERKLEAITSLSTPEKGEQNAERYTQASGESCR